MALKKKRLKKDKKKLWFRAKIYGWGWYPYSWQGWAVLLLYLIVILSYGYLIDMRDHSVGSTFYGVTPIIIIATGILIGICILKGEKPGWRWGV